MFKIRNNIRTLCCLAKYLKSNGYYGIGIASSLDKCITDKRPPSGIVIYPNFKEFNVFW